MADANRHLKYLHFELRRIKYLVRNLRLLLSDAKPSSTRQHTACRSACWLNHTCVALQVIV